MASAVVRYLIKGNILLDIAADAVRIVYCAAEAADTHIAGRSEERRVGKECYS